MLVFFVYTTDSCTIFNKNKNVPGYEKRELGRHIVNLEPLHLSRELRWVRHRLKRLGYTKTYIFQKVCEQVAHGLRTKEEVCLELYR